MTIWIPFGCQQGRGSVVMTGDPTGVQTMEKKIETLIHLEFGMNNLFVRLCVFLK